MCSQLFRCCKLDNILVDVPECSFGIIDNAGFFDKVIYGKGGEEFGSSVGGKYVVWSCKIISQRLRAVFSDKNSSCILNRSYPGTSG